MPMPHTRYLLGAGKMEGGGCVVRGEGWKWSLLAPGDRADLRDGTSDGLIH